MIRFLFRFIGFLLLAAAFAALVLDGTRSIAGGRLLQYSLGDTAAWLGGARYAALLAGIARLPSSGQPLAQGLLAVPSWIAAGVLGFALLQAGRRSPEPRLGFSSRRS